MMVDKSDFERAYDMVHQSSLIEFQRVMVLDFHIEEVSGWWSWIQNVRVFSFPFSSI